MVSHCDMVCYRLTAVCRVHCDVLQQCVVLTVTCYSSVLCCSVSLERRDVENIYPVTVTSEGRVAHLHPMVVRTSYVRFSCGKPIGSMSHVRSSSSAACPMCASAAVSSWAACPMCIPLFYLYHLFALGEFMLIRKFVINIRWLKMFVSDFFRGIVRTAPWSSAVGLTTQKR